jgi:UDP-2,4-diacetamido-2,4,6-trideoxy-beta-L-altropyranose hydrolase
MRVVFRADASVSIGSGHVMRCLTLAGALAQRGAQAAFLCCPQPGDMRAAIEAHGFPVIPLQRCDDSREAASALEAMGEVGWLVVDHYGIDERWERAMRSAVHRIFAIDDLADRRHDCDLLLDQNLRSEETSYRGLVPPSATVLMGPSYALLRDEFRQARTRVSVREGKVRRIVVFFGGSDPTNETEKAVAAIRLLNRADIEVDVIVGASNPVKDRISDLCAELPYMRFHCQVADMAHFLEEADLALGAAGVSSWERLALGVPALVVAVADNQLENMRQLDKLGAAIGLGVSRNVTVEGLAQAIGNLLSSPGIVRAMSEKTLGLVDGEGANRVLRQMEAMR